MKRHAFLVCFRDFSFSFHLAGTINEDEEMVYDDESSVPKGIDVEEVEIQKEEPRSMWGFFSYVLGSPDSTPTAESNPETKVPPATTDEIQNATENVRNAEDEPGSLERQATFVQDIMNIISEDFNLKSDTVEEVSEAVLLPEEPTEKTAAKYAGVGQPLARQKSIVDNVLEAASIVQDIIAEDFGSAEPVLEEPSASDTVEKVSEAVGLHQEQGEITATADSRVQQPVARQKSIVDNMLEAASIVEDIIAEEFGPAEPEPEEPSAETDVAESLNPVVPVQDPEEAGVHQESFLDNILEVAGMGQATDIDEPYSDVTTEHRIAHANEERSMEEKLTSMVMDDQSSTADASPDSSHANSSAKLVVIQEAKDETICANCIVCDRRGLSVHSSRRRAVTCDAYFPN